MSFGGFDPEILKDFLTESGELLDQLEGDLVSLESTPEDPALLNQVFRALHTIKGSASFLQLNNLVKVAHAAESALNAARNAQVIVDKPMMDRLLNAVDLIKCHMGQIQAGEELSAPEEPLVLRLAAYGEGKQSLPEDGVVASNIAAAALAPPKPAKSVIASTPSSQPATSSPAANAGATSGNSAPSNTTYRTSDLVLGAGKTDLFDYLVTDVEQSVEKIREVLPLLSDPSSRLGAGTALSELGDQLAKAVEFFELESMSELAHAVERVGHEAKTIAQDLFPVLTHRLDQVCDILSTHTRALKDKKVILDPIDDLVENIDAALRGIPGKDQPPLTVPDAVTPELDAVAPVQLPDNASRSEPSQSQIESKPVPSFEGTNASPGIRVESKPDTKTEAKQSVNAGAEKAESTIRVEVGRLESLMNLVGELVLQKNRIAALSRRLSVTEQAQHELCEAMTMAAGGLDRVTGDIQLAVMRTRMQPLEKLFGKYPRLIRDLATKTGKRMQLVIEGGDTEVDKSVLEALGDPLVHLLRNSADHGIDTIEERAQANKSDVGTIFLRASHEGSHVRVQVGDDGRGLSRERISKKAIERGLASAESIAQLSDRDIYRFIMEAGFSTADKVSDLSGRGVGMDVVKTNIETLKGTIELDSTPGQGSTVTILIPLTVAILPAMLVAVGMEIYAIPLGSIVEIVKPEEAQLSSIGGQPVMRLREGVLPLVSASEIFNVPGGSEANAEEFTVVLSMNNKKIGLMVTRMIGQQEIVIKPLEGSQGATRKRAVSGATVRDDGGVSLIVDVAELIRMAAHVKVDVRAA